MIALRDSAVRSSSLVSNAFPTMGNAVIVAWVMLTARMGSPVPKGAAVHGLIIADSVRPAAITVIAPMGFVFRAPMVAVFVRRVAVLKQPAQAARFAVL